MNGSDPKHLLEASILHSLTSYSNVHRGSGHKSVITSALYEEARKILLDYMDLDKRKYNIIFCSPGLAEKLEVKLKQGSYHTLSTKSFGLALGVTALAVKKGVLPGGSPPYSGGGTTKLISRNWVIWNKAPAKFEAGTPMIVNVIAFARALQLIQTYGEKAFSEGTDDIKPAGDNLHPGSLNGLKGMKLLQELRNTRIGREMEVPTSLGKKRFINLDSSASTPTFEPVWESFRKAIYTMGENGHTIISETRKICSQFLGASQEEYDIWFTSNTTESINIVAGNLCSDEEKQIENVIVSSVMEHSSNDLPWRNTSSGSLLRISVNKEGFFDSKELDRILSEYNENCLHGNKRISLVSLCLASNVLGTCNDMVLLSSIAHSHGAKLMVDGAQAVAHRKIDLPKEGIDAFAFSAHKVYAPFGCGILVTRKGMLQAGTETLLEKGEENVAGIAALGTILRVFQGIGMDLVEEEEQKLTDIALSEMSGKSWITVFGPRRCKDDKKTLRVGVIAFNLKDTISFRVGKELARHQGIGIRVGCHCAHILVKHILGVGPGLEKFQRIMQTFIPGISFPGVARASFGIENTEEDVKVLLNGLEKIHKKSNRKNPNVKLANKELVRECVERVYGI